MFLSFEQFGLAPQFRRAAEAGEIEILEMDGPALAGGLRAAACDLPYTLIPDLGTDLPRVNPTTYQRVATAPGERKLFKVPAIAPDLVLLHAQRADELGNIQFRGAPFFDAFLARAGKRIVVSVDEIVSTEEIRRTTTSPNSCRLRDRGGRGAVRRPSNGQRRGLPGRRGSSPALCAGVPGTEGVRGLSRCACLPLHEPCRLSERCRIGQTKKACEPE